MVVLFVGTSVPVFPQLRAEGPTGIQPLASASGWPHFAALRVQQPRS
jgi:hypothetical protein